MWTITAYCRIRKNWRETNERRRRKRMRTYDSNYLLPIGNSTIIVQSTKAPETSDHEKFKGDQL